MCFWNGPSIVVALNDEAETVPNAAGGRQSPQVSPFPSGGRLGRRAVALQEYAQVTRELAPCSFGSSYRTPPTGSRVSSRGPRGYEH